MTTGENLRTIETCLYSDHRLKGQITSLSNELRDLSIIGILNGMQKGATTSEVFFRMLSIVESRTNSMTTTPVHTAQEEDKKEAVQIIINGEKILTNLKK